MQLYNFRCSNCDHVFEGWDTMTASAEVACPSCKSLDTVRLISKPRLDYTGMATSVGSGDGFSTAVDRWVKAREEKMAIEKRNKENHNTYD